jgi:cytochrome oxidase Cu insertion factor (SCO1/SenC/PrrC family)
MVPAMPRVAAGGAETQGLSGKDLLTHKWTLLYWGPGQCSARCRLDLYNTRQVRTALGHDMDRVQRVFIADGECCDMDFIRIQNRDLITVRSTPEAAALREQLRNGDDPATADRVYLIDPLGNLMMSYAPDAKPKGMLQDLKRLLGLSSVG